jgi:hypothetical protein
MDENITTDVGYYVLSVAITSYMESIVYYILVRRVIAMRAIGTWQGRVLTLLTSIIIAMGILCSVTYSWTNCVGNTLKQYVGGTIASTAVLAVAGLTAAAGVQMITVNRLVVLRELSFIYRYIGYTAVAICLSGQLLILIFNGYLTGSAIAQPNIIITLLPTLQLMVAAIAWMQPVLSIVLDTFCYWALHKTLKKVKRTSILKDVSLLLTFGLTLTYCTTMIVFNATVTNVDQTSWLSVTRLIWSGHLTDGAILWSTAYSLQFMAIGRTLIVSSRRGIDELNSRTTGSGSGPLTSGHGPTSYEMIHMSGEIDTKIRSK